MENYDFSTLKQRPSQLGANRANKPLSQWKADIPMHDGDATLKLRPKQSLTALQLSNDDFENDFDIDDFEEDLKFKAKEKQGNQISHTEAANAKTHQHHRSPSELSFLSDSSSKSPSRASVSSLASSVSVATSWDQDDDFGFDFDEDDKNMSLDARFKARNQRAEREAQQEANELANQYQKTVSKRTSRPFVDLYDADVDDMLDMDMEQLTLRVKNGTVNRNIKLNHSPVRTGIQQTPQHNRLLKGMRSIAQLPNKRSEGGAHPQPRVRAAVSMFDLGSRNRTVSIQPPAYEHQTITARQRPLTAYKEPTKSSEGRKKKPTTIRNPIPNIQRQERDGMVFNPQTMMWEGNDFDASRFDSILDEHKSQHVRPQLITKEKFSEEIGQKPNSNSDELLVNGMHFDKRTLSWVFANEEEYDDPFEGIDENPPTTMRKPINVPTKNVSRKFTNESHASSASSISRGSVARSESSSREVFDISSRMISEWKHADERFIRKFGKWIGGEEERTDALNADQHFYEMVRHA